MINTANLPAIVPVFPLLGALLLPRTRLPLHLFEPRYLQMFDDTLKTSHRIIAMIQPTEVEGPNDIGLHRIGCAGRISQFSETEDGRYMITLVGVSRFRVIDEVEGFTPYRRCTVDWSGFEADLGAAEHDAGLDRVAFLSQLRRYFKIKGLDADWESLNELEDDSLIDSLSMMLDFTPEDKQALLEAHNLRTRRETLTVLMEFALRSGPEGETLQ